MFDKEIDYLERHADEVRDAKFKAGRYECLPPSKFPYKNLCRQLSKNTIKVADYIILREQMAKCTIEELLSRKGRA